jgi:hypothetical protein
VGSSFSYVKYTNRLFIHIGAADFSTLSSP